MGAPPLSDVVLLALASVGAWLATYWLHSALLLAGVWALTRLPFRGRERVADVLWKAALVGAIVTATARSVVPVGASAGIRLEAPRREVRREIRRLELRPEPGRGMTPDVRETTSSRLRPGAAAWLAALASLWIAGSVLFLARYWRDRVRLARALAVARDLDDRELEGGLAELRAAAGLPDLRCRVADHLGAPLAIGSRDVVLPSRAWTELTLAQRRSVLAHEVAHLARRDPAWLAAFAVVRAVAWLQPLHRLALAEWSEAAEFRCDAWAARATGRPKSLAAALATVASWTPAVEAPAPVAAFVGRRSPLVRRVERLLRDDDSGGSWRIAAACLALACALLLLVEHGPALAFARPTAGPAIVSADEHVEIVRIARPVTAIPAPHAAD